MNQKWTLGVRRPLRLQGISACQLSRQNRRSGQGQLASKMGNPKVHVTPNVSSAAAAAAGRSAEGAVVVVVVFGFNIGLVVFLESGLSKENRYPSSQNLDFRVL